MNWRRDIEFVPFGVRALSNVERLCIVVATLGLALAGCSPNSGPKSSGDVKDLRGAVAVSHLIQPKSHGLSEVVGGTASTRWSYINEPHVLYYNETNEIKLLVPHPKTSEAAINLAFSNLAGDVEPKPVILSIGSFVSAQLSAPKTALDIEEVEQKPEKFTADADLTFTWFVTPRTVGKIPMHLDIFESADPASPSETPVQVLQEDWTAQARGLNYVKFYVADLSPTVTALWSGGAAVASVILWLVARRKSPASSRSSDPGASDTSES